jgi:hypothetical protein
VDIFIEKRDIEKIIVGRLSPGRVSKIKLIINHIKAGTNHLIAIVDK